MLRWFFLLLSLTSVIHCLQQQSENKSKDVESKPIVQSSVDQGTSKQQQDHITAKTEQKNVESQQQQLSQQKQESATEEISPQNQVSARQQHILQQQYAPVAFLEPQYQYPGFGYFQGKQPIARGQPQIVVYGPGQGQPILINHGSPPGNFLVPQQPQPGPNFVLRDQGPVFLAGYPKPAHIPPIEKDAEEIPTNPSKIPPLPTSSSGKPEKLESLNEGKTEVPENTSSEADGLEEVDKKQQTFPKPTNLQPGERFFILNGEPLFRNYAFQNYLGLPNFDANQQSYLNYPQPYLLPSKQALDQQYNTYPFGPLLLRNEIPKDVQGHFINPSQQQNLIEQNIVKTGGKSSEQEQKLLEEEAAQQSNPSQPQQISQFPNIYNLQATPYDFLAQIPQSQVQTEGHKAFVGDQTLAPEEKQTQSQVSQFLPPGPNVGIETRTFPQGNFFRSSLPFSFDRGDQGFDELGQFRFSAPSGPYYPTEGEDIENDAIVVNANLDEENPDTINDKVDNEDSQSSKSSEPSTAQASPGAVALAGPGGVAGAAPKATALAGKGGLAVSSPQATAVAGTKREKDTKKPTDKVATQ